MKLNSPFSLTNPFYSYRTIQGSGVLCVNSFAILFVYSGELSLGRTEDKNVILHSRQYLECYKKQELTYKCSPQSIIVVVESKEMSKGSDSIDAYSDVKDLDRHGYIVSKPWGREVWLTGPQALHGVVLKYIEVDASTKTSLQVHMQKYESNFIASGKAIFRWSNVEFKGKDVHYPLTEEVVDTPTVIDVSPLTIHQVEASTKIDLIEASTCHLDDVIRLSDDSGRSDGRIEAEHQSGGRN